MSKLSPAQFLAHKSLPVTLTGATESAIWRTYRSLVSRGLAIEVPQEPLSRQVTRFERPEPVASAVAGEG